MNPITCAIIDDEPLARENMRDLLRCHPEIVIVCEAETIDEARKVLRENRPNAVFLDIQMPGGTGFDVLAGLNQPLRVVFVTAYDEYAVRAFQVNAVDYLLKPIDRALLAATVKRLTAENETAFPDRMPSEPTLPRFRMDDDVLVRDKGKCLFVPLRNLFAIRACGNYTEAVAARNQTFIFRQNLRSWQARLPTPPFLRLDRSLIINADQATSWKTLDRSMELLFQNGNASLTVGRTASERFKKLVANQPSAFRGHSHPENRSRQK